MQGLLSFLLLALPTTPLPANPSLDQEIASAHAQIHDANTRSDRSVLLQALAKRLSVATPDQVSSVTDESIQNLTDLLNTDGDIGRVFASHALAAVACRAHGALPSLRATLAEVPAPEADVLPIVLAPSFSPYDHLERAIQTIENATPCLANPRQD
ncbi:hypothetical protein [Stenotrophomonas sp. PS02289]|uniref:hypothetical protein n=1 Tax=Stenotrophomonas sp. PS02289 TaxID=2991422 RepID=UPI00249AAE96|nr:hypothetical protein [Stenotrophomonas sp. PS02289]